ncbi:D-alanyl-D-alanine carboxypeptidase family protein [Streptomyces sp. NPDC054796]
MNASSLTRRRTAVTAAVSGTVLALSALVAHAMPFGNPAPEVEAEGVVLLDEKGHSVYAKDAGTPRPMASTAKIMVASVVLGTEGVDLEQKVQVRQRYRDYVTEHHASTADLQTGDEVTVRQLLYASLLPSGADAAYALADTFGTGATGAERIRSFVAKMNAKARELRLRETTYKTFDGHGKDTSTPAELAKLARHAMENATFRKVVKTKKYKGEAPAANGRTRTYTWTNTNQLLGAYDGAIGIKTGTTARAGKCLVFAATRGDKTFVGALMDSGDRFTDAAKILNHGFGDDDGDVEIPELPAEGEDG